MAIQQSRGRKVYDIFMAVIVALALVLALFTFGFSCWERSAWPNTAPEFALMFFLTWISILTSLTKLLSLLQVYGKIKRNLLPIEKTWFRPGLFVADLIVIGMCLGNLSGSFRYYGIASFLVFILVQLHGFFGLAYLVESCVNGCRRWKKKRQGHEQLEELQNLPKSVPQERTEIGV